MKTEDKTSYSLNYNDENGKYYIIDNNTGKKKQIHNTGEYIKKFNPQMTGSLGYKERIQTAGNVIYSIEAKSLRINKKELYYTPKMDKFLTYTQFPNGLVIPYFNQKKELQLNEKKRDKLNVQRQQMKLMNQFNQTLNKQKKNADIEIMNLTGTLKDLNSCLKSKQIKVLKQRTFTNTLPLETTNLKATKIINGMSQQFPNIRILEKQLQKIKKKERQEHEKAHQYETKIKLQQEKLNQKISTNRFNTKVQSTAFLGTHPAGPDKDILEQYQQIHTKKYEDTATLLNTIKGIQTKTFDQQLNFVPRIDKQFEETSMRPLSMYERILGKEKEERLTFKIVQIPKERPSTKGRFSTTLLSCAEQSRKDKKIARQMFPEMFEERLQQKRNKNEFVNTDKTEKL